MGVSIFSIIYNMIMTNVKIKIKYYVGGVNGNRKKN